MNSIHNTAYCNLSVKNLSFVVCQNFQLALCQFPKFPTSTAPSYETGKQMFYCSDYCCDEEGHRFIFPTAAVLLAVAVPSEITAPTGMPPGWFR